MGRYYALSKAITEEQKENALNAIKAKGNVKSAEVTEDGKFLVVETEDGEYTEVMRTAVNMFNQLAGGCELKFIRFAY